MSIKLSELLEYVHRFETVDVRDEYGMEKEGGYGLPDQIYDNLYETGLLDMGVKFITVGDNGQIIIILDIR